MSHQNINKFDPTKALEGTEVADDLRNAKGVLETGEMVRASREQARKTRAKSNVMLNTTQARTDMILAGAYHPSAPSKEHSAKMKAGTEAIDAKYKQPEAPSKARQNSKVAAERLLQTDDSWGVTAEAKSSLSPKMGATAEAQAAKTEIANNYVDDPDRAVNV